MPLERRMVSMLKFVVEFSLFHWVYAAPQPHFNDAASVGSLLFVEQFLPIGGYPSDGSRDWLIQRVGMRSG